MTISAVVSNNSPVIKIVRSKHNEPKMFIGCEVKIADQLDHISKYPYECSLEDEARLLIVKTYDGSIIAFTLP